MNFPVETFFVGAAIFLVGVAFGYWLLRWKERNLRAAQSVREKSLLDNARRNAEAVVREARLSANEEALKLREHTEQLFVSKRKEMASSEQRLNEREILVNHQLEKLMQQEKILAEEKQESCAREQKIETARKELAALTQQRREELEKISQISAVEAREKLLKQVEQDSMRDAGHLARHILEEAKLKAEERARKIISVAIQRYAGEHTFETSTATVALTGDDMKGRIIGREGRNIRAFEAATGITVLIDDTPNAVVLSGFDPVRREIARESMERLILDGRIHPTRIEEVVAKVSQEMDETILRAGEEAVLRCGLSPVHGEVSKILGRLRFRHSFSQNVLEHSIEVAHLMGLMAAELGIDVTSAKRAGLLHDIGKALSHEIEGPHAIVGGNFIKQHGESDEVVDGVASHHDEVPHVGLLGILVGAADAISASRPGARSETMTTYIKRVEALEKIGLSFPGVEKCFAVQAGRELRVIVTPEKIDDEQSFALARNIARKIEDELQYPGQIRVTVMRETRCVEFAK
ncbi:MAG: ribonuclease Y [Verrucomicrobiota bacterium]